MYKLPYSLKFARFKNFAVFVGCTLTAKNYPVKNLVLAYVRRRFNSNGRECWVWLYIARTRARKFYPQKIVSEQNLTFKAIWYMCTCSADL